MNNYLNLFNLAGKTAVITGGAGILGRDIAFSLGKAGAKIAICDIADTGDLIDDLGTDLVRINLITSNEGLDDADWRIENVKSYKTRLEFLYEIIKDLKKAKGNSKWLLAKL